jgi:hypothetical protein
MLNDAGEVRRELKRLGVQVGGSRAEWWKSLPGGCPQVRGDRDVVAYSPKRRKVVIAEVEGDSSGQPEQKLYKAIGQIVLAASPADLRGWTRELALVVDAANTKIVATARNASALKTLGVSAFSISAGSRSTLRRLF